VKNGWLIHSPISLARMQAASTVDTGTVWSRAGWMTKKGKKRFFVLCGGELQWFAKELEPTTSQTQVRQRAATTIHFDQMRFLIILFNQSIIKDGK
jgi:hypothetical protein